MSHMQTLQPDQSQSTSLKDQNEMLFNQLREVHHLTDDQMAKIRAVFARSGYIGQGNPSITLHPLATGECEKKIEDKGVSYENPEFEKICGARYMAPLYNPATEQQGDANTCIDQFEFPDIPCTYLHIEKRPALKKTPGP